MALVIQSTVKVFPWKEKMLLFISIVLLSSREREALIAEGVLNADSRLV